MTATQYARAARDNDARRSYEAVGDAALAVSTADKQGIPEQRAAELGLTPRELTVLALLAEGLTAAAIARRLAISPRTVNKHQENLYRKLGTTDRLTTVILAQDLGLVNRGASDLLNNWSRHTGRFLTGRTVTTETIKLQ
jgi:DNA-binding NarL/FixJ family response regulator